MAVHHARNCRVYVGDVDISAHVREVNVHATAGELVTTTLELLWLPAVTVAPDGATEMRFGDCGVAMLDNRRRAIRVREDE